jgi:hypothetical protein
MSWLTELTRCTIATVGPDVSAPLREGIAAFETTSLVDEERLAAVATTIAATAHRHHRRHQVLYLEAVKTWALEVARNGSGAPARSGRALDLAAVAKAAGMLISGLGSTITLLHALPIRPEDRLVTQLAPVAWLLGRYDAAAVRLTLVVVERALREDGYKPGDIVRLPAQQFGSSAAEHTELTAAAMGQSDPAGRLRRAAAPVEGSVVGERRVRDGDRSMPAFALHHDGRRRRRVILRR